MSGHPKYRSRRFVARELKKSVVLIEVTLPQWDEFYASGGHHFPHGEFCDEEVSKDIEGKMPQVDIIHACGMMKNSVIT